jgi:hypothetical protein
VLHALRQPAFAPDLVGRAVLVTLCELQKGMHKTPEFLALSRWGQVPVLVDGERVHLQTASIVEHLAGTLGRFQGPDPAARQAVREWLYWDADVLFPPIFNCYAVQLGRRKLLAIHVELVIADYHPGRAEAALSVLESTSRGVTICVRPSHHRRPVLLRRRSLCGNLCIRLEALDQHGAVDQARDGTGGFLSRPSNCWQWKTPSWSKADQRMAVITWARMRPSTGPLPNRSASASAQAWVAASRPDGSRASISFRSGVPWQ